MNANEIEQLLKRITLINAVRHGGQAQRGAVLGRLLAERPALKACADKISKDCAAIVDEINSLSAAEQRKIVEANWPEELEEVAKKREEKVLPPLPHVEKYSKIVTRFSPNPDGAIHIGSTRAVILCHDYARIYGGKFILRFEDTDPRLHKPVLEFYDSIREDVLWLGCKWEQEVIQSDRLQIYYDHAKTLLERGHAYVCTCSRDSFKTLALSSRECPCRSLSISEQLTRWEKMLDGSYGEETAIVRVKTDLQHPNPAVRDWPALRIVDPIKYPHPRAGDRYRVWPLYNFACGIDDHLLEVSHIIRGKEHLTNEVRQTYMFKHFGWQYPETLHYGRLKIVGTALSKSKMAKMIADGAVSGFADPRLPTLIALRRRGIVPEALRRLIMEVGPRPVDATLSWDNIYSHNRKIIDRTASRFFYVGNPVQIDVSAVPRDFVSTPPFHPDLPERGNRLLQVKCQDSHTTILVTRKDLELFSPGRLVRLMELFNVRIVSTEQSMIQAEFHSETYDEARRANAPLVHWLPSAGNVTAKLVMPDADVVEGLAERSITAQDVGSIVQLVRVGFGRIDSSDSDSLVLYFGHE